jgi:hypothetical protein
MRMQGRFLLAPVAAARATAIPCPSWQAIFIKGLAHVSAANALLRRCFLSWPWPRIYQHSKTVAVVPVERNNEQGVHLLRQPETLRLAEIDAALASSPTPLPAGLILRLGTAWSGRYRARSSGTLNVAAGWQQVPQELTPTLHHGPIHNNGEVDICLTYDPRVLCELDAARILTALEDSLQERVLTELRYLESVEAA